MKLACRTLALLGALLQLTTVALASVSHDRGPQVIVPTFDEDAPVDVYLYAGQKMRFNSSADVVLMDCNELVSFLPGLFRMCKGYADVLKYMLYGDFRNIEPRVDPADWEFTCSDTWRVNRGIMSANLEFLGMRESVDDRSMVETTEDGVAHVAVIVKVDDPKKANGKKYVQVYCVTEFPKEETTSKEPES